MIPKNVRGLVSLLLESKVVKDEITRQLKELDPKSYCTHDWNWIGYSESLGNRCICSKCGKTDYIAEGYF